MLLGLRAGAMALAIALGTAPMAAASQQTDPDLKALIPDAAVAQPQDWAKAAAPAPAAPQPAPPQPVAPADAGAVVLPPDAGPLNPASPLRDIQGLDLAWPDFSAKDQPIDLPSLPPVAAEDMLAPVPSGTAETLAVQARPAATAINDRQDRMASGRLLVAWDGANPPAERAELEQRFRLISTIQNLPAKERDNAVFGPPATGRCWNVCCASMAITTPR